MLTVAAHSAFKTLIDDVSVDIRAGELLAIMVGSLELSCLQSRC